MLVLSRKADESIQIDGNIEIKILEIRGNRVRLGITAPSHVAIHRTEIMAHMTDVADVTDGFDRNAVPSLMRIAR